MGQTPGKRVLFLLQNIFPDIDPENLEKLSIGRRDSLLMELYEILFGPETTGIMECPNCGEKLEIILPIGEFRGGNSIFQSITCDPVLDPDHFIVNQNGWEIDFRLPNSWDLEAIEEERDTDTARTILLRRCILKACYHAEEIPFDQISFEMKSYIVEKMAHEDPLVNIQIPLSCPFCNNQWEPVFDIIPFFWNELSVWAERILYEVHILASAYGWCEADILSMDPRRRKNYLEMIHR